jgi:putative transposase
LVDRKLKSADVIEVLAEMFLTEGPPEHIHLDNGPEFCAKAVRE